MLLKPLASLTKGGGAARQGRDGGIAPVPRIYLNPFAKAEFHSHSLFTISYSSNKLLFIELPIDVQPLLPVYRQ